MKTKIYYYFKDNAGNIVSKFFDDKWEAMEWLVSGHRNYTLNTITCTK